MATEPRLVEGDLLDQEVEVIVNAWNPGPARSL